MRYLKLSFSNKFLRLLWNIAWCILYRPTPKQFHQWRCFLLKLFGAEIATGVHPYPTAKIWAPWNLKMGANSCLGEYTNCYNVASIEIGENSTVSQYSYLCSASHDYNYKTMPLVVAPIIIGDWVWITADVFIAPGVNIGDGVVITARSSVFHDIPSWKVARGNPAVPVKERTLITS